MTAFCSRFICGLRRCKFYRNRLRLYFPKELLTEVYWRVFNGPACSLHTVVVRVTIPFTALTNTSLRIYGDERRNNTYTHRLNLDLVACCHAARYTRQHSELSPAWLVGNDCCIFTPFTSTRTRVTEAGGMQGSDTPNYLCGYIDMYTP